jgi:hypothetical protein
MLIAVGPAPFILLKPDTHIYPKSATDSTGCRQPYLARATQSFQMGNHHPLLVPFGSLCQQADHRPLLPIAFYAKMVRSALVTGNRSENCLSECFLKTRTHYRPYTFIGHYQLRNVLQ